MPSPTSADTRPLDLEAIKERAKSGSIERETVIALVQEVERLTEALKSIDARFEEIIYAKGTLEQKVECMAQEAYFGQREAARALAPQPKGAQS